MNEDQKTANERVARAFERGVTYFDVAPSYGNAEHMLGPALEPYRKDVFLACKTTERSRDAAKADFEESLRRMRTDYFDLYQLHAITDVGQDVEAVFAPDGVMDFLMQMKREGRVRYIGFSAHSEEAALAAFDRYDFDSVLFPVNFTTWHGGHFGEPIMKRAQETGAARLALKGMALQKWQESDQKREKYTKVWYEPITDRELAGKALRWALNQPITAALPPGEWDFYEWALEIAENLRPPTPEENDELVAHAEGLAPIFPLSE